MLMQMATPRQAFRALASLGALVILTFGALAGKDLWTGRATLSFARGTPSVTYDRKENPAAYWSVVRKTALVGGAFGGGLIGLGFLVLRLNPRSPRPRQDDPRRGSP